MPRNKLSDLNNHLFAQLERLNDEDVNDEKMQVEIKRAKAMSSIASEILKSSKLTLDAARLVHNREIKDNDLPESMHEQKKLNGMDHES